MVAKKHGGTAGAIELFKNARIRIEPTRRLSPEAMEHFIAIVETREATSWTPHDIGQATSLAEICADRDQLQAIVHKKGFIAKDRFGSPAMSAEAQALERVQKLILAMSRGVGVSARKETADMRARALRERRVRSQNQDGNDSESLLA